MAANGAENWERKMSVHHKIRKISLTCVLVAAGLAAGLGAAAAEQPSTDQIIRALKPARLTRGLTASPADEARKAEEASFVNSLRNRPTRSLSTAEREQITSIAQKRPSIDLEVNFEYNSDTIGSQAMPQVKALGEALSSADLKGGTFIFAGHTDAKGGEAYNQGLSERRADAVKRFLLEKYGIDASNLVTVGYGKSHLKNPSVPFASENRRVQVINASEK
jgi:outer membrane protein OmpA-like peptidoglycan-associated protein